MGWPSIPELIYTDAVRARHVDWSTKDKSAGRLGVPGAWGDYVPCSVSAAGADDVTIHSREGMVVTHTVTCDERLGYMRDQLEWQETGAILTVVGVEPAGDGTGRIWVHYVEERQLR